MLNNSEKFENNFIDIYYIDYGRIISILLLYLKILLFNTSGSLLTFFFTKINYSLFYIILIIVMMKKCNENLKCFNFCNFYKFFVYIYEYIYKLIK